MNIDEFSGGMQLKSVDLDAILSSNDICDKLRVRLTELKMKCASGDEVLYCCSEREEWDAGMGSEGYVLVRDNEIIDYLVLRMN